jgi:hypothetical protein
MGTTVRTHSVCIFLPYHILREVFGQLTELELDYVFVDEHNRHKRLKGAVLTTIRLSRNCLQISSYASLRRMSTSEDQM